MIEELKTEFGKVASELSKKGDNAVGTAIEELTLAIRGNINDSAKDLNAAFGQLSTTFPEILTQLTGLIQDVPCQREQLSDQQSSYSQ